MKALGRYIREHRFNKKGFSLVELLCAVTVLAILVPALIQGFILASKLNMRSRYQERADAAANSVYEGLAAVSFDDIDDYLSANNGWTSAGDIGTHNYYVTGTYEDYEDCKVTVTVDSYSDLYAVPDLNLSGMESNYLSLSTVLNRSDGAASYRISNAIKTSTAIQGAIAADIIAKHPELENHIVGSLIAVNLTEDTTIVQDNIGKYLALELNIEDGDFVVDYDVRYRYPLSNGDPSVNSSSLKLKYTYYHEIDGVWMDLSSEFTYNGFVETVPETGSVSVEAEEGENKVILYYNSCSDKDWINIKPVTVAGYSYGVCFIEQSTDESGGCNIWLSQTSGSKNNFYKSSCSIGTEYATVTTVGGSDYKLYTNNTGIIVGGIPDGFYEMATISGGDTWFYRVRVDIEYKNTYFATVTGTFDSAGNSVGKFGQE